MFFHWPIFEFNVLHLCPYFLFVLLLSPQTPTWMFQICQYNSFFSKWIIIFFLQVVAEDSYLNEVQNSGRLEVMLSSLHPPILPLLLHLFSLSLWFNPHSDSRIPSIFHPLTPTLISPVSSAWTPSFSILITHDFLCLLCEEDAPTPHTAKPANVNRVKCSLWLGNGL